ncbi:MAG: anti-sigma F factor [Ruminococcaceae bacterium]|nr:anti-sigma F factor [Oscillospiraceae bacterium]
MNKKNKLKTSFMSIPENESLARVICASFISQLNPTLEELTDVKTAVSEAVTNCIVHAYENKDDGIIYMDCMIEDSKITVDVKDYGKGIEDVKKAMEPMYTSNPEAERSGMGFTVMETFMDEILVDSIVGVGTKVHMTKTIPQRDF